jgi:hypothetical protein
MLHSTEPTLVRHVTLFYTLVISAINVCDPLVTVTERRVTHLSQHNGTTFQHMLCNGTAAHFPDLNPLLAFWW